MSRFLIYGASGYTGRLVAERVAALGLGAVLAGRSEAAVRAVAEPLGLPWKVAPLDDPRALDRLLDGVGAVLHCAGPFVATSRPMADACLRARTHYLDITGEVAVFEALAARDAEARAAGVVLLPGVGFDVVPTDCLAAHLTRRLPTAKHLTLAFRVGGGMSRGTAATAALSAGAQTLVRRDGDLVPLPGGILTRRIDFGDGHGPRVAATITWGDLATAYRTTGIPNIETYMAVNERQLQGMALAHARPVARLLATAPARAIVRRLARRAPAGPAPEARARSHSYVWGQARDTRATLGATVTARLRAPNAYTLTVHAAVAAVRKVLLGECRPGFLTPALAFGADFVLELDGVAREDVG
ncbi:MAG: saccharopine dehydrogenase family protein [Gemmatimonadaceae bacterium]